MSEIFDAIDRGHFEQAKRMVTDNPQCVHIKDERNWTVLDCIIACGILDIAKYLWDNMGGRPNLEIYRDGIFTPVHSAAHEEKTATLEWVFTENVLSRDVLQIVCNWKRTPLDCAIAEGKLEMAKYLWGMGGQPNLDMYHDGGWTPVHSIAWSGKTVILKWIFAEKVLPLRVLNIKSFDGWIPLDCLTYLEEWETADLFQRLIHLDAVFLAMQRAKRDYQCVLRRLPDELLDMVVDEVAARYHLEVVW